MIAKKLAAIIATSVVAVFTAHNLINLEKEPKSVQAYTDTTEYYQSCTSTIGADLLSQVKDVVKVRTATSYDYLFDVYADSDVDSSGRLIDIYSNTTNFTPTTKRCGSYSAEGGCWNREHTIPKSWWPGDEKTNQGADPFIVMASDGYVNNRRSNYALGIVGSTTYVSNNSFSKLGSPASQYSAGAPSIVFEPNDMYKGDLARAVFYAVAAYSTNSWTSGDGSRIFSSSGVNGLTSYARNLFIKWHNEDPVSEWELKRNDAIYLRHCHNRNPFIDHPEWVETIWGQSEWSGSTNITISNTSMSLNPGNSATIYATSSNNSIITWSTSDSSVVSLATPNTGSGASNHNTITAHAVGTATITAQATINATTYTKTCTVHVTEQSTSESSQSTSSQTSHNEGEDGVFYLTSTVAVGDKIVFAYNTGGKTSGFFNTKGYLEAVDTTFSSDRSYISSMGTQTAVLTVSEGGYSGYYMLSYDETFIGGKSAQECVSSENPSNSDEKYNWSFNFAGSTAQVASKAAPSALMQYNTNSGASRFRTYTSSLGSIQIYKLYASPSTSESSEESIESIESSTSSIESIESIESTSVSSESSTPIESTESTISSTTSSESGSTTPSSTETSSSEPISSEEPSQSEESSVLESSSNINSYNGNKDPKALERETNIKTAVAITGSVVGAGIIVAIILVIALKPRR